MPFSVLAQLLVVPFAPTGVWQLLFASLIVTWFLLEEFTGRLANSVQALISDRGSALAVVITLVLAIMLAFKAGAQAWLPLSAWAQWLGLLIMTFGLAVRYYAIHHLGRMFTRLVEIAPDHKLITTGPYSIVRHPSYTGLLILFLGIGLAFGDWLSVVLMVYLPLIGILYRIKVEENALLAALGDEYKGYMGKVRSLIPFVF